MTEDITKFGRSSAAMKSQFISKLRETFALNRTDAAEPSNLNSGIIGMMMDVYANAVEDGYFNSNTRAKEMFVSSAKFDDSLYLHASACKINSFFATPAAVDIIIAIPVDDIVEKAVERTGFGYRMMTLNGKTKFILDRYYYTMDYPVDIVVKTGATGKNVISCKYDLTEKNEFSDVNSTYITGVVQTIAGVEYYTFKVRAHQIEHIENEFVYTPSSNTSGMYTIPYTSQLAGFKVLYRDAADDEWEEIEKVYYGVLSSSAQKFHYYRLKDDSVTIEFSVDPKHWKPSLNGRIKIDMCITEGSDGNFNYTSEEVIPYLQQDDTNVYQSALSGTLLACELATTTSSGGEDMPTIDDVRNMVIDHRAARSTIISDKDLSRTISNLGMSAVKQRDDLYDRRFMTYALVQNSENGFILPGRTGELYIPEIETINQSEVNGRLVDPNNVYQFWLADDEESYNTTRFIAKQPEEIKTSVTIRTNYFKMDVANSHNLELVQNLTEKCRLITFDSQLLNFAEDEVIVFSGDAESAYFNNGAFTGQTIHVRTLTSSSVSVSYNDSSSIQIIHSHEYRFIWNGETWDVSDLGVVGSDPSDDSVLPTVTEVNIPQGSVIGSEFIFKNHCNSNVSLNYYDYSTNIPSKRTFIIKPSYMVKFTWTGVWKIEDLGEEGSLKTPTNCLMNKDWDNLYAFYKKYDEVLMMCPYLIKIFKSPYFVNLYDVYNNSYIRTVFAYNDYNSSEKFAINGVNIIRSDVRDKQYKVYCDVSVSETMYEKFMSLDINEFPMKLKIEMFKDDQSYAYFELNTVEEISGTKNKLRFSTLLDTDNVLHDDDMIRIINRKYSSNIEATNVIPTNDPVYTDSGVIPNTYFIPFKTKLKVYVLNVPDVPFESNYASHMLDSDEDDAGFIVTDAFETEDLAYFVRDMSDVFSTTLEVVKVNGSLPKYPANVPMKYTEIVYDKNDDGSLKVDPVTEDFIILHDIGDPVLDSGGNPVYAHRAGEDLLTYDSNGNLIYETEPEIVYIIKNIPLISMMTMLDESTKSMTYSELQHISSELKGKIIPRLVGNNSIAVGLYNTMGPSIKFVQGSKNSFTSLNNLSVSIELSVKFNSSVSDTESVVDSIKLSIEEYMRSIVNLGYFYATDLISYLKDMYSDIDYIEFANINGLDSSIQTIKTSETVQEKATPEYITIAQTLSENDFKLDGTVKFTPNIVVNTII